MFRKKWNRNPIQIVLRKSVERKVQWAEVRLSGLPTCCTISSIASTWKDFIRNRTDDASNVKRNSILLEICIQWYFSGFWADVRFQHLITTDFSEWFYNNVVPIYNISGGDSTSGLYFFVLYIMFLYFSWDFHAPNKIVPSVRRSWDAKNTIFRKTSLT